MFESWLGAEPQLTQNRRIIQKSDAKQLLWLSGMNEVSVINMQKFEAKPVQDFWKLNGQDCFATVVTANDDCSKIAGIGHCDPEQTLHVMIRNPSTGKETCTAKPFSQIAPSSSIWLKQSSK